MSKKIIVLIITSIIGLIGLSLIQGYLIKNTYSLKKNFFVEKAKKRVGKFDAHNSPLDSIQDILGDVFIQDLDRYHLQEINKKKLLNRLRVIIDSLNPSFIKEFDKKIASKKLPYNLKYHKTLKSIIIRKGIKADTIFKASKEKQFKLLGYKFKNNPDLTVGNSAWETERSFKKEWKGEIKEGNYHLFFESQNDINIDDFETIVFSEMKGLLLLSVFIFVFVIGVLFYSIKNLITQKKIADIKTDFINNITHEFKTPLATLSLATKMLRKQENENLTTNSTINTIERQNIRLQKLIDQVLNNSLGYKEITLKKESLLIKEYINTILNDFQITLKEENIQLQREILNTNETIFVDNFYMTTAILNILENAVKYGGNVINIKACIEEKKLLISITDNGIGVSKKQLKYIFDKFFRAENKEIHNVKGLGLGLYYSNQIIKAHEGVIFAESEKEKSTTFKIHIPL